MEPSATALLTPYAHKRMQQRRMRPDALVALLDHG